MEKAQTGKTYDAFISYRHLPADMRAAERLQRFLETYRAPNGSAARRRIPRVFRDKSELPTGRSLDASLTDALLRSDWLIILLSETTKDSHYCMEEVRLFKEAHGGRLDRILPVLVSGDPKDVLPDLLRYEETGEPGGGRREAEPLCCDLRFTGGKRRRENNEFLRIAAPILGCAYDDLFQRDRKRRRTRLAVFSGASLALLAVVLAVVLVSYTQVVRAYDRVTQSERQTKSALLKNYIQTARNESLNGDPARALAYYAYVLSEDPSQEAARTGALIELQKRGWLAEESSEPVRPAEKPELPDCLKDFGTLIQEPDGFQNYYAAMDETAFRVWIPGTDAVYEMENLGAGTELYNNPAVAPVMNAKHTYFAVFYPNRTEDMLCVYSWEGKTGGQAVEIRKCSKIQGYSWSDLHERFETGDWDFVSSDIHCLWADGNSGRLLIDEGGGLTLVNVYDGTVLGGTMTYRWTWEVLFSPDGEHLALVSSASAYGYYDHRITVYNSSLYRQAESEQETACRYRKGAYSPDGNSILWATRNSVSLLNAWTAAPRTAKIFCAGAEEAAFTADGLIRIVTANGHARLYREIRPESAPADAAGNAADSGISASYLNVNGLKWPLAKEIMVLVLQDKAGNTQDTVFEDQAEAALDPAADYYEPRKAAISPDRQTAVAWDKKQELNVNVFYRVTADSVTGKLAVEEIGIPEQYRGNIESAAVCNSACAVLMTGGNILVYREGETLPGVVFRAGNGGSDYINKLVMSDAGFMAVECGTIFEFNPENEMETKTTLELWDWTDGSRIADLMDSTPDQTLIIDQYAFPEKALLQYSFHDSRDPDYTDSKTVAWRLDAEEPDGQAAEALRELSCYRVTESGELKEQAPSFSGNAGNWQAVLEPGAAP